LGICILKNKADRNANEKYSYDRQDCAVIFREPYGFPNEHDTSLKDAGISALQKKIQILRIPILIVI